MYRFGLGDYASYMGACTGGPTTCSPLDQLCVANYQNIVDACNQQYVTDPNSPHNNPNSTEVPALMTPSSASYQPMVAAAGGSVQLAERAAGETPPPGVSPAQWFGAPGAMIAAAPPPASQSSPATAAPPAGQSNPASSAPQANQLNPAGQAPTTNVMQSSPAPADTVTSFRVSSIPAWGWLALAGIGFLAFSKR